MDVALPDVAASAGRGEPGLLPTASVLRIACPVQRIIDPFSVQTPADSPYGVLFAFSIASAGVRKVSTLSTGPKISSCAIR
jgi:hypothetical protein